MKNSSFGDPKLSVQAHPVYLIYFLFERASQSDKQQKNDVFTRKKRTFLRVKKKFYLEKND
jgi:hypothetical protein